MRLVPGALLLAVSLLASCAAPHQRAESLAARHGLASDVVKGATFLHRVYRNGALTQGVLHVYIEGDGTPHPLPTTIATDPTPRELLMLELMLLDGSASVYVGRPCYFRLEDPACDARYWTLRRYGPEVVESLMRVVEAERVRAKADRVTLLAHSGGAPLVWAVASRTERVTRVITLAGNLDVPAWTRLHGYTSLEDAFNPAATLIERPGFAALHYVGGRDRNIPARLSRAAAKHSGGEVREMPDYTHRCCWKKLWPSVLRDLASD